MNLWAASDMRMFLNGKACALESAAAQTQVGHGNKAIVTRYTQHFEAS